ncbi:MAG: HNH endonuclease [Desulfomonilaceae bacterium]
MCSICREKLTLVKKTGKSATLGEMCHIVGENEGSARYYSNLEKKDRNSHSNLILLCSNDHVLIDRDEEENSIEYLHMIKSNHELWVSETLSDAHPDPEMMVYSSIIDTITMALQLENWVWFDENAVRDLIHEDFIEARGILNRILLGAIWPEKMPELKQAIVSLIKSYSSYITHFESNAEYNQGTRFFRPDKSYSRFWNPDFDKCAERQDRWSNINFILLCEFTNRLNEFADAVRQFSNPMYFRLKGRFLLDDVLGYRFGNEREIFDPAGMETQKRLQDLGYKPPRS